jgi:hypothetical protein
VAATVEEKDRLLAPREPVGKRLPQSIGQNPGWGALLLAQIYYLHVWKRV